MIAMWVTPEAVLQPLCRFGSSNNDLALSVQAVSTKIWQIKGITEVSHACELSPLVPGRRYFYKVGDNASGVYSEIASFVAKPDSSTWAPSILVYGDLGADNDVSLPKLIEEAASGHNDFVLHVGDLSYNFNDDGGKVGQTFMRDIDPIASKLPYMNALEIMRVAQTSIMSLLCIIICIVSELVHGSKGNSVYYSFDAGPAHFLIFSSEVYFWQLWDIEAQYKFIKGDLEAVDRSKTPWIVTMAHRPMYCSNADTDDCTKYDANLRIGLPVLGRRLFQLETLFHKHKVDLSFWAHEHSYERLWPVFDHVVLNGTTEPYVDPGATVHIVTGNAGCKEKHDRFDGPRGNWSAVRSERYGKLQVLNASHLRWRQFDAMANAVVDEITLVKTRAPPLRSSHSIDRPPLHFLKDLDQERQRRESIFSWSQACTLRGNFPQDGCSSREHAAKLGKIVGLP
eukprot:CAMPEP_0169391082 /NCGR_PEP_ID=MMETSP1017-20121227/47778_1 /TAXON_ID=342587 /ORGANISM="Karlodinium micrum, Strain CCMP2283" /LENGTH=453 /DNA_ID=CAMNT_0009493697 /DNA_START=107 /DNA_END=1466 /DNA_ORIENTATION=-